MDGYEDLPILLSVIQSNKVNIYCIYIKNYPGIEWRRVAFIGVFPGVRSPRMQAHGERQIVRERESQISLSLCACLGLLRRRHALQPLPLASVRVGHRQSRPPADLGQPSVRSPATVKTRGASGTHKGTRGL